MRKLDKTLTVLAHVIGPETCRSIIKAFTAEERELFDGMTSKQQQMLLLVAYRQYHRMDKFVLGFI